MSLLNNRNWHTLRGLVEKERKGCASWRAKDEFEDRKSA